ASGSVSISSEEIPTMQADSESAKEALPAGCVQNCAACGVSGCSGHGRFYDDRYQDLSSDDKSDEDGLTMIELEEEES
ncbi:MAG: hypothetical protein K2N81_13070, partial [Acetatifactor sp.]|nr:hypothetical protein [Acetatifactor sp.]